MSETECYAFGSRRRSGKLVYDKKKPVHDMALYISMIFSEIFYKKSDSACDLQDRLRRNGMKVACMNISLTGAGGAGRMSSVNTISGRQIRTPGKHTGLKSVEEKIGRQERANRQIGFWESQIENLKSIKCDTVDDIAKKLEKFHAYEDEIAAVKAAYNSEQIWHAMDEAREMGEKIAEAVERMEPKTPEEQKEKMQEDAAGTEEGTLSEIVDEFLEKTEELAGEKLKEVSEAERKDVERILEKVPENGEQPAEEDIVELLKNKRQ